MSWKTTDSAKRSGISDYNRGTIKQNTERFSADYAVISDLSLQYLYGFRNDGVNDNALEIRADSLAFNKHDSSGVRALRIAIDDSNNALIGRKVSAPEAGLPDLSDSLCFKDNGNIILFGDNEYIIPNTGGTLNPGFSIHSNVGIDKELYVDKDTHFYSNLDVSGNVDIDGGVIISGNTDASYVLDVDGSANINGNVDISGDLTVFGVILPHFIGVSGDFRVGGDLEVLGDTSLQDFTANDGSMNDLSVNNFTLFKKGHVRGDLIIDGSLTISGELVFTGTATEVGTVSVLGDASYSGFLYGGKNLYLGSKHQQDDSSQASKFIQATYTSMQDGSSIKMCFGKDLTAGNQGQLSYYHNSDDSSRNTVTLGVFKNKNNIAINSDGNVSIGRNLSNVTTTSSLDVSGSVKIAAQSDYIYTTPSLHIDNTSRNDSTGASIKLTGKRNFRSENVSNSEYPYTTGADIIFENYNDANPTSGSDAKIATKKIHGVIKTFQTDNSWNIGDMGFYGQDISSLYTGTDTSGITEFMRFDASSQFVRFSKDVGIGGVKGEVVNMTLVSPSHALPQYPDPSAVLDLRTYTYYGQTGRSEQPGWKGGNILLPPENNTGNNNDKPNGLIWKPLAGEINTTTATFEYNYTKESAGIKFMPAANFYRGGLAFFTNNTADVSTNAVERMRIDEAGNVGIGTSSPSSTLHVNGTAKINGQLVVPMIDVNNPNQISSFSGKVQINNNTGYSTALDNNDPALFVLGGVKINGNLGVEGDVITKSGEINLKTTQTRLREDNGDMLFITLNDERMRVTSGGNVNITANVGIGMGGSAPSQKLDVNGYINANGYRIGGNPMGIFGNTGNSELLLSIDGSGNPALRVHSNNNIAIGHDDGAPSLLTIGNSINSNSSHPSTAFDEGTKILLGNQGSNTSGEVGSYYVIGFGAFNSTIATSSAGKYPPAYIGYQQQGYTDETGFGDLVFGTKENGVETTQALERMRITKDGKIGIANSNPQATLHVKGEAVIDSDVSIGTSTNDGRLTVETPGHGTGPNPNLALNKALSIIDGNKNGTYVNIGTSSSGTSAAFGLNWFNSNTNIANPTDVDNALVLTCFKGYNKVGLNTIPWGYEYDPILHIESKFNNGDPGINGGTMLQHPQVLIAANPTDPGAGNNNQYATLELKGSYVGNNGEGSGTIAYGAGIRVGYGDNANRDHGNLELYTTEPPGDERKTRLIVGNKGHVSIGQPVDTANYVYC